MTRGRILILLVFAVALTVFLAGARDYLTLEALSANRARLLEFVARNAALSVGIYMGVYITTVALSVPGSLVLMLTGGFIFGPIAATTYITFACTIGSTIILLLARYVLGDVLRRRAGPGIQAMEAGFQENALNYLMVIRLIPVIPFFLVNLACAFLNVPLRTFIIGTFIGSIPVTFVYATVGAGIGDALDAGVAVDASAALRQPTVIGGLAGLMLLSLLPVIYKKVKARGAS